MKNERVKEIILALTNILEGKDLGPYSPVAERKMSSADIPFDVRDLADVSSGSVREAFLSFKSPKGFEAVVTHYGVFCDAQFASQVEFWPTVDGKRVYPYQGTPDALKPERTPFKIALGVSNDLSESSLINAPMTIKEGQTMLWSLTNTAPTSQTMGVRMKGYLRSVNLQSDTRL